METQATQNSEIASMLNRAGNSIEWFKCNCGNESNLLWTFGTHKSRILACSKDCAVDKVKGQIKLGFMVAPTNWKALAQDICYGGARLPKLTH
jgi:hypothetical protein